MFTALYHSCFLVYLSERKVESIFHIKIVKSPWALKKSLKVIFIHFSNKTKLNGHLEIFFLLLMIEDKGALNSL